MQKQAFSVKFYKLKNYASENITSFLCQPAFGNRLKKLYFASFLHQKLAQTCEKKKDKFFY